jgi:hypothetical protein
MIHLFAKNHNVPAIAPSIRTKVFVFWRPTNSERAPSKSHASWRGMAWVHWGTGRRAAARVHGGFAQRLKNWGRHSSSWGKFYQHDPTWCPCATCVSWRSCRNRFFRFRSQK